MSYSYRTAPHDTDKMPPGIPWIIGNEAAERFSFYGMRTILTVFMVQYLWLMDSVPGTQLSETVVKEHYHDFVSWVYFTPLLGALLSDIFLGKYRTIISLSLVYCAGHAALACMGSFGNSGWWLFGGLMLICIGSGGIKPCVSANVGDQFGKRNRHLLTRIYNWFYFSINVGSFISSLLTPWVLQWWGPHWAFGIPGVLMAIATLLFWMGRKKFVHVPPGGMKFVEEAFSREGLLVMAKLIPFFMFFVAFWALFDQTGSSWVLQARQMDRHFLGIDWLESQIQAINPILILTLIPLFTFFVYPAFDKFFPLTPLRKIGIGLFVMTGAYALSTWIQTRIDLGHSPSIGWQFLAYVILTCSEVMVSIVGLEFAYTQAPRTMKSIIMSIFLLSIFGGNQLVKKINEWIATPSAATEQLESAIATLPPDWKTSPRSVVLPGFDGTTGTPDDFVARLEHGKMKSIELPAEKTFSAAVRKIEDTARENSDQLPAENQAPALGNDPWGHPLRYKIIDSDTARIWSDGPDGTEKSRWDMGATLHISRPSGEKNASWLDKILPSEPWLDKRRAELGLPPRTHATGTDYETTYWSGGGDKLEGAAYYRFFTWLMLATAVAFIPFSLVYKPKTYLQD